MQQQLLLHRQGLPQPLPSLKTRNDHFKVQNTIFYNTHTLLKYNSIFIPSSPIPPSARRASLVRCELAVMTLGYHYNAIYVSFLELELFQLHPLAAEQVEHGVEFQGPQGLDVLRDVLL